MKLVLLAIGMVFSVVATNAWASGCNPNDAGQDEVSMEFMVSGQLVCVAGSVCVFDAEGSDLKLTGPEVSTENRTQYIGDIHGKITNHRAWGSCFGIEEKLIVSIEIKGQKFSGNLSSYSGN